MKKTEKIIRKIVRLIRKSKIDSAILCFDDRMDLVFNPKDYSDVVIDIDKESETIIVKRK